jgi:two-component system phosphate regulon response regulator PhoB
MKRLHRIFAVPPPVPQGFVADGWLNDGSPSSPGAPISHVLVVDPDLTARDAIRSCLEAAGHRARFAGSGEEALKLARGEAPELVVTELALPDLSGLGLCRSLREDPALARMPIVMLSASAAEMDRVVAFEIGVDDFVAKPFHPRELALRVGAILRRARKQGMPARSEVLQFQRLSLDLGQHDVRVDDRSVPLTPREFDILSTLMHSAGRVLSRRQILEEVWGTGSGETPRVVDTHVKWIRRKLGPAGSYLETLRGVGYRFSDEGSLPAAPSHVSSSALSNS